MGEDYVLPKFYKIFSIIDLQASSKHGIMIIVKGGDTDETSIRGTVSKLCTVMRSSL
jgi:hypothetical protein